MGYNPCFSGSSIATESNNFFSGGHPLTVTILVFLAALLQHQDNLLYNPERDSQVTILVFLAALLQHEYAADTAGTLGMLQSLFFWQLYCNDIRPPVKL